MGCGGMHFGSMVRGSSDPARHVCLHHGRTQACVLSMGIVFTVVLLVHVFLLDNAR